jgi:tetratricopeptide (TPR) repeat protein
VANLALPATVQAVLAARIDRLADREKEVLQTAAVIGKEVPEAVLRRVSEVTGDELAGVLRTLIAADFLYEATLFPEVEYTFKHPLTQEVAYHSQLGARRARLHGSMARVLQALYPEKLEERAAVIAHHVEQAGEPLDAARWHARAAQWASMHDRSAALRHWQRVRRLLAPMIDSQEATSLTLAADLQMLSLFWVLGVSEEEVAIVFSEGKALASRAGDVRALASLTAGYAGIRLAHGAEDHIDYAREAVKLADESGEVALRRVVRALLTRSLMYAGHWSEALACSEDAMERLTEDQTLGIDMLGYNPHTWLADLRAVCLSLLGRVPEALQWFQKAIQRARDDHDLFNLGVACSDYGAHYSVVGDAQVAIEHARQGAEIGEKVGGATTRMHAYAQLAFAYLRVGSYPEAAASSERSLAIARESHAAFEMEPLAKPLWRKHMRIRGSPTALCGPPNRPWRQRSNAPAGSSRSHG